MSPPRETKCVLGRTSHPSRPSQVPRPTRSSINPAHVEVVLCEEFPALARIDECQIRVEDAFPTALDGGCGIGGSVIGWIEEKGPFLGDKGGGAGEGGVGEEGEHMDSG